VPKIRKDGEVAKTDVETAPTVNIEEEVLETVKEAVELDGGKAPLLRLSQ
jgi:hypothetical protein